MTPEKLKRMYQMYDEDPKITKNAKRVYAIFIICCVVGAIGLGASIITGKNDGPVEQIAEAVIKAESGVEIDLTPPVKQ